MKMRPQFNLRFRDAEQFLDVKHLAGEAEIPVNEWILRQLEKVPLLLGARLTAKKEANDAARENQENTSAGAAVRGNSERITLVQRPRNKTVRDGSKRPVTPVELRVDSGADRNAQAATEKSESVGQAVTSATPEKAEWRCEHCGNSGRVVKGGKTVCFGCGRPA
jgi:hypothetical protein